MLYNIAMRGVKVNISIKQRMILSTSTNFSLRGSPRPRPPGLVFEGSPFGSFSVGLRSLLVPGFLASLRTGAFVAGRAEPATLSCIRMHPPNHDLTKIPTDLVRGSSSVNVKNIALGGLGNPLTSTICQNGLHGGGVTLTPLACPVEQ